MTDKEIQKLAEALGKEINKGISRGFSEIPKTDGMGRNIGDPSASGYDAKARAEYIMKMIDQNRKDEIAKIDKEIEIIRTGSEANTRKGRKAINTLEKNRKDLDNGKNLIDNANKQAVSKVGGLVDKISGTISGIAQIAGAVSDGILAHKQSQLKEGKNIFEKTQKSFQANMEMSNTVASNIIATMTSFTTQLATEAAQSLTSGAKEEANARIKLFTSLYMAEREFGVAEQQRKIDEEKAITAAASGALQGISSIASLFGPIGMIIGTAVSTISSAGQAVQDIRMNWKSFDVEKMQQWNGIYNDVMGRVQAVADKMKNITDGIDNAANDINNHIRESDTVYKNLGLSMGFTGDEFSSMMRKTAMETTRIFAITAEEMKTMQESFINNSSRAVMLTGNEYNQIAAISKTFGVSQGEVANIMGTMNIFNVSVSEGYDKFNAMYHTVTKMGLSTTKFAKDLSNNLKLAQKYNFKGGLDNMIKMTQWAQQTRFNLNNAVSFADKLSNGSLAEVLESSAKLQVLGGSAGIYSDPLAMMYEAGADVGSLAKRQAAMFNDITGTFNSKTGETEFNWYENRMLAARAQAMGMDVGEVKDMIRQNQKQGVINKQLSGINISEEDKLAIGNRAQYKNGQWMVNTRNGEMNIQDLAKLNKDKREQILLPENQEDAIMQIAENTRSMVENEKANLEYQKARVGRETYSTAKAASDKNIESQNMLYNTPEYVEQIKKSITATANIASIQAQKTADFVKQNGEAIEQYRKFVEKEIEDGFVFEEYERNYIKKLAIGGIKAFSKIAEAVADVMTDITIDGNQRIEALKNIKFDDDDTNQDNSAKSKYAGMTQAQIKTSLEKDLYNSDENYKKFKDFRGRMSNGQRLAYDTYNNGLTKQATEIYNSINDGIIRPNGESENFVVQNGKVTGISPNDTVWAAKPDGDIFKWLNSYLPAIEMLTKNNQNNNLGNVSEIKINFGGRFEMVVNDSIFNSDNFVKYLNDNPAEFAKLLVRGDIVKEGMINGRPSKV